MLGGRESIIEIEKALVRAHVSVSVQYRGEHSNEQQEY